MAAIRSVNVGFSAALAAVPLLFMPSLALWALAGRLVRRKGSVARFLASISVTSIVALVAILMLDNALSAIQTAGSGVSRASIEGEVYVFMAGYYLGSIIGAAATYFWLTKEKR